METYLFTPKKKFSVQLTLEQTHVRYAPHVKQGARYVLYGLLASLGFKLFAGQSDAKFVSIFLFGVLPALRGTVLMLARRDVVFGTEGVEVSERRFLTVTKWFARYSDFLGVRTRRRIEGGGIGFVITELVHPSRHPIALEVERGYGVTICREPISGVVRDRFADTFGVPVIKMRAVKILGGLSLIYETTLDEPHP